MPFPTQPSLLRTPDFLKLWAAHTFETLASLMGALALVAVLVLHATPQQMALLVAAGTAPPLVAGLAVGVWVDRLRRKPLLIAADIGRAAALASVPLAFLLGFLRIEHLYAVALVNGLLDILFDVAHPSFVPTVVRREHMAEANAKLAGAASVVEVGAMAVSGWTSQLASAIWATALNAGAFLLSGLLILSLRTREHRPGAQASRSVSRELVDGLSYLWRQPVLRALAWAWLLIGLTHGFIGSMVLLFALRDLAIAPGVFGLIDGVGGLSALVGAVVATRLTRRYGIGPVMVAMGVFGGIGALLIPLAGGSFALSVAFLLGANVVSNWAWAVFDINDLTLRQSLTPDDVRGRVNGAMRWLRLAATFVGALAASVVVTWAGIRWTLALGGVATLAATLVLALSPVRALRSLPDQTRRA